MSRGQLLDRLRADLAKLRREVKRVEGDLAATPEGSDGSNHGRRRAALVAMLAELRREQRDTLARVARLENGATEQEG